MTTMTIYEDDLVTQLEVVPRGTEMTIDQGRGPQGPPGPGAEEIGDISDLETEDKSSVIAAINEINMSSANLALLYENAKAG